MAGQHAQFLLGQNAGPHAKDEARHSRTSIPLYCPLFTWLTQAYVLKVGAKCTQQDTCHRVCTETYPNPGVTDPTPTTQAVKHAHLGTLEGNGRAALPKSFSGLANLEAKLWDSTGLRVRQPGARSGSPRHRPSLGKASSDNRIGLLHPNLVARAHLARQDKRPLQDAKRKRNLRIASRYSNSPK